MDHDEVLATIRDKFWVLGQSSAPLGNTQASQYLPLMQEAADKLEEARSVAIRQLLPDSKRHVWLKSKSSPNPYNALAKEYPEVRRVCIVDIALYAVQWAMQDLINEGTAPVKETVTIRAQLPPEQEEKIERDKQETIASHARMQEKNERALKADLHRQAERASRVPVEFLPACMCGHGVGQHNTDYAGPGCAECTCEALVHQHQD